jgi:predicted RNA-binding protein with TRAM domain
LKFCKRSSMALNRLTDTSVLGIELHIPHNPSTLLRNPNQSHPLVLAVDLVTNNLRALQGCMSLKHLLRDTRIRVDGPVIHSRISHESNCLFIDPFPKGDIFVHDVGFEFGFQFEVEDLELSLGFEGDDFGGGVHDCTVGCDGSAHDGALVVEVDDDDVVGFVYFLTNTTKGETSQIVLLEHKMEEDCTR